MPAQEKDCYKCKYNNGFDFGMKTYCGYNDDEFRETWNVPDKEYFDELIRISQHYIVWGCNYYDYQFAPGRIVWDKCNANSSFSDAELAATDLFNSVRLFRFMWNGMLQGESIDRGHVMQGNKAKNEKRIHPTQKPIALYAWLLQNYANPDAGGVFSILTLAPEAAA